MKVPEWRSWHDGRGMTVVARRLSYHGYGVKMPV